MMGGKRKGDIRSSNEKEVERKERNSEKIWNQKTNGDFNSRGTKKQKVVGG